MKTKKRKFLRRYTNLPSLFDILQNKRITLLNPTTWDDTNDSYFIEKYRIKSELKSILALCFTEKAETYHHWKVFSNGTSGVCISFDKDLLLKQLKSIEGIRYKSVEYKRINQLENSKIKLEDMPFIKRLPYEDEKEFRIIYESKTEKLNYKYFDIEINCIDKITLNPWIPTTLLITLRKVIKEIINSNNIKVHKTTLISNEQWKKAADKIA